MVIEGEAYTFAMLGVWLWWRPVFSASGRRWRTWRQGLYLQGRVIVAVSATLAVAAIYEVAAVTYMILMQ